MSESKQYRSKPINIAGQRFGKLVAIEPTVERIDGAIAWRFQCDCGNEKIAPGSAVKYGNTKSCGCGSLISRAAVVKMLNEMANECDEERKAHESIGNHEKATALGIVDRILTDIVQKIAKIS